MALAGERLDRIVAIIADVSRADASSLVSSGGVSVDGAVSESGKVRLREGQLVAVDLGRIPVTRPPEPDPGVAFEVVYEDEHIVVVNKPAGLVVHPAPGHDSGTLVNGLLAAYPEMADVGESVRPGIVHRLDAGTTGLMVTARTAVAYEALVSMLSDHEVGREYLAIVRGHLDSPSMVIDAPIGRDPRDPLRMAVVPDGKWARTRVEREEEFDEPADASLVRCELETGRTHQIRVHLAAIGHPVVGDPVYGGARAVLTADRPMLHAARLTLTHPATGETMAWESPIPADMSALLVALRTR